MTQGNFIHFLWSEMNRQSTNVVLEKDLNELRVELIPIDDPSIATEQRFRQIHELVTNIILMADKRGRPAIKDEEVPNAA